MNRNPLFLVRSWNKHILKGQIYNSQTEHFKTIRYEDLINDIENEKKRIEDFLGINTWKGIAATGDLADRIPDNQRGMHLNILNLPDRRRIDAWKKVLLPEEIYFIEKKCNKLMVKAGYVLDIPVIQSWKFKLKQVQWIMNYIGWHCKHCIWLIITWFKTHI